MSAKSKTFLIIAVLVAAGLGGFFFLQHDRGGLPAGNKPVPILAFAGYEGQEISLDSFSGKPLIINAWASWCPFCVAEMPDFAKLQEEFGDKITVVLVNRAESLDTAKKFSDKVGVTGRLILLLDSSDSFYRAIGAFSMPETIFVDKDGQIVFHKRGPMSLEEMGRRTEELFNEKRQ